MGLCKSGLKIFADISNLKCSTHGPRGSGLGIAPLLDQGGPVQRLITLRIVVVATRV
jgi:hypothetical protein